MGASSSSSLLEEQLVSLLKKQGTIIKSKTAKEFLEVICTASPWFVTSGGLNVPDWEQVKTDLQKYLHKEGPDSIPIATFSLWRLVKDALLSDNMKVKEQVAEAEAAFGEVQNEEVAQSLQTSDASELESEEEDEESKLEEEIRVLKRKLKKISCRDRPPARNPDYCSREILPSAPLGEFKGGVAYPVIETLNAEGQAQRQHEPLEFKAIKQLKEAVMSYGPLAPFTLAIYESFSSLFLTPSDWQQLCRATLSGGDYLIWRSEFHEHCQATAARNAAAGFPQRNLDMLTGAGQYNTLAAQITYDPAVYAQIATAAVRAWKNLPNKGAGDQLSKVMQGPSEPFSEFVDRLLQLAGKLFGDADQAMPIVKQLAFENANKYYKKAIRPHKNILVQAGLQIAPEKVQERYPYQYLGHQLLQTGIRPQKVTLRVDQLKTLNDFQRFWGDIQWLRPSLRTPTGVLRPLYDILKGDSDPSSPRRLTPEGHMALIRVQEALERAHVNYIDLSQPLLLLVFCYAHSPTGVFWQTGPILWIHSPATPTKKITPYFQAVVQLLFKGLKMSVQTFGEEPEIIVTPYTQDQLNWLQANDADWTILMCTMQGTFDTHYPSSDVCQFFKSHPVIFPRVVQLQPIPKARVAFTDGTSHGRAVVVSESLEKVVRVKSTSAQMAEVQALILALQLFSDEPLNIYTDSQYVARAVAPLETAAYIPSVSPIHEYLLQLQSLIWMRHHALFVGHIRAHMNLPGPLSEGNQRADVAT